MYSNMEDIPLSKNKQKSRLLQKVFSPFYTYPYFINAECSGY